MQPLGAHVCASLVEIWMLPFIRFECKSSSLNRLGVLFKFPVISPSWNYAHSFSKFCKENCWILCDIYHNSENLCCFFFSFSHPYPLFKSILFLLAPSPWMLNAFRNRSFYYQPSCSVLLATELFHSLVWFLAIKREHHYLSWDSVSYVLSLAQQYQNPTYMDIIYSKVLK